METKHTPGPWEVETGHPEHDLILANDGREIIAEVWVRFGDGKGEDQANARLIASSPTLYAYALRQADAGDVDAQKMLDSLNLSK
jgi:hypothetical protein